MKNTVLLILSLIGLYVCRTMDPIVTQAQTTNNVSLIIAYLVFGVMLLMAMVPILWNISKENRK